MKPSIIILLLICHLIAFGQSEKVKGSWKAPQEVALNNDWIAQWIWMDNTQQSDVMLARKTITLNTLPNKAILQLTASTQYQLYINGEYILRGPARSTPHHQSFDVLDVTKQLRTGKNSIAVRVHYQRGTVSYQHAGRPGLLVQLELDQENDSSVLVSDPSWKVSPDTSWDNRAQRINRFQLMVNDKVDLQKEIKGWHLTEFDDSTWMPATALLRNVGWPSPQNNARPIPLTPPWTTLVPRDIPYLIEKNRSARNLIQATEMAIDFPEGSSEMTPQLITGQVDKQLFKSVKSYQKSKGPLVIPASAEVKTWLLLFDLGTVVNGMAQLEIEGDGGTKIAVLSAPFVVADQFSHEVVKSKCIDELRLSGTKDFWEATYFKPTRYLAVAVQSGTKPVSLYDVGIRQLRYPFEKKGQMVSSQAPWVATYFEASAKTIETCTTDAFTDNYRERRQYAQTGYYAALGNYWIFGDVALQRRYLIQVAQEQKANGIMPAYAPLTADDYMVILDSNCLYIRSLYNYFLYSGDQQTVLELLPAAKKLMELLHSYTDALGMLNNPPYPYWLDHAINDRRGASLNLNGHYLDALEDFANLMKWLGDTEQNHYRKRADKLGESIRALMWDEGKGLFADALIDGNRSELFSEHGNAMVLALGLADASQAEKITKQLLSTAHNYIKNDSGMTLATPAMSYFLYKGLCEYGYIDAAFEMFRNRFDHMLRPNSNHTLWEEWWLDGTGRSGTLVKTSRSDAQTESAFPPALFAEYLLGIRPLAPGMAEVEIRRTKSSLKEIEGQIPTPKGKLSVKWGNDKSGVQFLELQIPEEMTVQLDIKSLSKGEPDSIRINGTALNPETKGKPYFKLEKGSHTIQF